MEVFGFICALLIGVVMGIAGSGGSILCVPVFVYLFKMDAIVATTYSLFAIGTTSSIGAITNIVKGNVNLRNALLFGVPSILAVVLVRRFLVPFLPKDFFTLYGWTITRDLVIMVLFSILMIFSAYRMIDTRRARPNPKAQAHPEILVIQGFGIGVLTGLIGAGGGFLIVPALVILLGMPIKQAVGTSLFIVAINALSGFITSMTFVEINWKFLLSFTAVSIAGLILGQFIGKNISADHLKKYFGYFVLILGSYILFSQLFQF